MNDHTIEQLVEKIAGARKMATLSGAGLSAESGVPTFRDAGGLWRNHNPAELATPEAFNSNPQLVWEFYNWRREKVLAVEPNPAHFALVELEQHVRDFMHITQNVDGLYSRAGGKKIIEVHGNLFATRCFECDTEYPEFDKIVPYPSRCRSCNGLLRPGVVWFGEAVPAMDEAVRTLAGCDVFLVVGTSASVQPAASLALVAKQYGAFVAEFNIEATPLTGQLDLFVTGPVGQTLPPVVTASFGES